MQECNRHTHISGVITGDILRFVYIDTVIIVIPRIFVFISYIFFGKNNVFMTLRSFQICQPQTIIRRYYSISSLINPSFGTVKFLMIGDYETGNSSP